MDGWMHTHAFARTHARTHAYAQACARAHMRTRTHAHMHTCAYAHMRMRICTHAHMHTCTHAGLQKPLLESRLGASVIGGGFSLSLQQAYFAVQPRICIPPHMRNLRYMHTPPHMHTPYKHAYPTHTSMPHTHIQHVASAGLLCGRASRHPSQAH